eukprot:1902318-Rhodomonas_salina.1
MLLRGHVTSENCAVTRSRDPRRLYCYQDNVALCKLTLDWNPFCEVRADALATQCPVLNLRVERYAVPSTVTDLAYRMPVLT